ncbi:DNA ligase D [Domibacillus epiphyticus]|uniref:DNA ligase (ATP) n=1 Tax=Domibacillus epiphyticus TaxID=1714355 RepID=A0A1V2A410_9BACI|nr:DNA ligase D [Domibacillus epiphyticus]OMP65738.1 DNA ligase D [Domibacillus epiphyticus]
MKPMLLTAATEIPTGNDWLYEAKYDGFRCVLEWEKNTPILKSRNGKILNHAFPEIISFCHDIYDKMIPFLPLSLDGELVFLRNNYQSHFSTVQLRGRMRKRSVITNHVQKFPCHYVIFDLLTLKGQKLSDFPLTIRKQKLNSLFKAAGLPSYVNYEDPKRLQAINVYEDSRRIWKNITVNNGEGIVAKKKASTWNIDKRTIHWLKIKNWRYVTVILTKYDQKNGFFHGGIYKGTTIKEIVVFRHGLTKEEEKTLKQLFQSKGKQVTKMSWEIEPSICVDIACIDFDGVQVREPLFHAFNFEIEPEECHWQHMQRQLFPLPETVPVTHPEKPIVPILNIQKNDYLLYLQNAAPALLPFLHERLLTVIRYPHGVMEEHFYQKSCPDYAPEFVTAEQVDDIRYIICNDMETLLWLGNQLALEFHIPYQTRHTVNPTEIVFDLDPPSVNEFPLAIKAALQMKAIFDQFELRSFVKTSGGKGLQVYIPLPANTFSYEETRLFIKFVCTFLCEQEPHSFTTERLKKNRQNKLYLDYIQHDEGKTIIAPYSPRGNKRGLIATPLYWEEINSSLKPDLFTMTAVLDRLKNEGNPFRSFWEAAETQRFNNVVTQLKELTK